MASSLLALELLGVAGIIKHSPISLTGCRQEIAKVCVGTQHY